MLLINSYTEVMQLFTNVTAIWAAQSYPSEDDLLAKAEHATGGKRAKLYLQLGERSLNLAKAEFGNQNSDRAFAAPENFRGYVREAFQTANQTGQHIKQTEIRKLRQFGRRLEALKRSVAFDEQKPISEIALEIQEMRDDLLHKMFKK